MHHPIPLTWTLSCGVGLGQWSLLDSVAELALREFWSVSLGLLLLRGSFWLGSFDLVLADSGSAIVVSDLALEDSNFAWTQEGSDNEEVVVHRGGLLQMWWRELVYSF